MTKKIIYPLLIGALAVFGSCNSSSDEPEAESVTSEDVQVTAFSLKADKKVMANLDSVFFSIDLMNARIFNADSLPYGTSVARLIPQITTSSVSVAELIVPRPEQSDTVYNYLRNSTDSIDFSNGPVKLRLVSSSGTYERIYTINVNVHKMKADSLVWGEHAYAQLPGRFTAPTAQRSVELAGKIYTLVTDGGADYLVSQSSPTDTNPVRSTFAPGFTPDINSFRASADACYLQSTDGTLYKAATPDGSWQNTGLKWHAILAAGSDFVVGSVENGGSWKLQKYPGASLQNLPTDFPVEGTSQTMRYHFEMSTTSNILIVGGVKANGRYSADTWSYDGYDWVKLSNRPLPCGLKSPTLIPYFTTRMASDWAATDFTTLFIMGGLKADGTVNRTLYQSLDFGVTWTECPAVLQLGSEVTTGYGAQAFIADQVIRPSAPARIVKPITQWDCPYIYVYGGYDADGRLYNSVWRGVITRYTFKPVE